MFGSLDKKVTAIRGKFLRLLDLIWCDAALSVGATLFASVLAALAVIGGVTVFRKLAKD